MRASSVSRWMRRFPINSMRWIMYCCPPGGCCGKASSGSANETSNKYTTARNWNVRREIFTLAAMVKASVSRPKLCAPPPDRSLPGLRVGFLVGHWGCFYHRTEAQALGAEKNLERRGALQSTLYQSFRQRVFDVLL